MNDKENNLKVYNEQASELAKNFQEIGARVEDIDVLFSLLGDKKDPFILEVGCGPGRDAEEIVKRTKNYLGIDFSEEMINLAKKSVPNTAFEVGDLETYHYPENIDAVLGFHSLLHSDEGQVRDFLNNVHGKLSPEGIVYLSLKTGEGSEIEKTNFGDRVYHYYTLQKIKELAGDQYEVVYEREYDFRGQESFVVALRKCS